MRSRNGIANGYKTIIVILFFTERIIQKNPELENVDETNITVK